MTFKLPPLPFEKTALVPIMSEETLNYHYGKHHQGYVDKLNALVKGTEFEGSSLEEIILKASGPIFNNAAQVWNHTFFWNGLTAHSRARPVTHTQSAELAEALTKQFGSFEKFQAEFQSAAVNQFGSGWAWLVRSQDGSLAIRTTSNADNPMRKGETPLFTCDVWEHAYYIDYRNERGAFVKSIWDVVNWGFVQNNLLLAKGVAA